MILPHWEDTVLLTLLLACGPKATPAPVAGDNSPLDCKRPTGMFGPVRVADDFPLYGEGQTQLDQIQTSKDSPVEVCGVNRQLAWLIQTKCADGSVPYSSVGAASASRVGNVGTGGRCGSVIDHYQVPCPEGPYDVYIDLYMCRPGESIR